MFKADIQCGENELVSIASEFWRQSLRFSTTELVRRAYNLIHGGDLNQMRARQIVAAYTQAREYFENAENSDLTVRPLLLFYGVACLSRMLVLLMKTDGGEHLLRQSHGLGTIGWSGTLSQDVDTVLRNIHALKLKSSEGLFSDILTTTKNSTCLHTNSSKVDTTIEWGQVEHPIEFTFGDLAARTPDLQVEYEQWLQKSPLVARFSGTEKGDDKIVWNVQAKDNLREIISYSANSIEISVNDGQAKLTTSVEDAVPILTNSYLEMAFGSIPYTYISARLDGGVALAQIPIAYALSFSLGMLCRYFPTHWVALTQGQANTGAWPLVQVAITYIQAAYPRLIVEYLEEQTKGC